MISANSTTKPHAVWLVSPFVHAEVFATLTVCVHKSPISIVFVAIVDHESSLKEGLVHI